MRQTCRRQTVGVQIIILRKSVHRIQNDAVRCLMFSLGNESNMLLLLAFS